VQVFHGKDDRVLLTALEPEPAQCREGAGLQRVRTASGEGDGGRRHPEEMQQIWGHAVRRESQRLDALGDLRGDGVIAIGRGDPALSPQQFQQGQIRRRTAMGETASVQVRHPPVGMEPLAELHEQPGLAHAGLADDAYALSTSLDHPREDRVQRGHLMRTPNCQR
jgi:hypothetical protein